jgi:hypothetical protein
MRRVGIRLSVRTLLELVALSGFVLAYWKMAEESRPPGPEVRTLRDGDEDEGERVAALRGLSLMGGAGADAIPALVTAAREDPSPAVRRGAVHALMGIAIVDPGDGATIPVNDVLAGNLPSSRSRPRRPTGRPTFPLLHPRAEEVAANLVEVMRAAPDPSVRLYALRALRKVLDAADRERMDAKSRRKPGQPPLSHPASGRWVEATARAIAERGLDPDPEVAGHAIGFLAASRGKEVIPARDRISVLLAAVEPGTNPLAVELLGLNIAARMLLLDPEHPDAPRLLELAIDRMDDPAGPGAFPDHPQWSEDQRRDAVRASFGAVAWQLIDSADDLRDRPEAGDLLVAILSDRTTTPADRPPSATTWLAESLYSSNEKRVADRYVRDVHGGSTSYHGGFPQLPKAHESAMKAMVRDPRLIGEIWPRIDRPTRFDWLAGGYAYADSMPGGGWDRVLPTLADAGVVPEFSPDRCSAILAGLLDEPEPEPGEAEEQSLRALLNDFMREQGGSDRAGPEPIELAREIRRLRSLAVMTYFARGAPEGDEGVARLVGGLRELTRSGQTTVRSWSAWLLGSIGPPAAPALPELAGMVEGESDEATRDAAEQAIEAIRSGGADH